MSNKIIKYYILSAVSLLLFFAIDVYFLWSINNILFNVLAVAICYAFLWCTTRLLLGFAISKYNNRICYV